jgi:hypothetical protein
MDRAASIITCYNLAVRIGEVIAYFRRTEG